MSLEDFFTLAELKNGLVAPARVEELVSVMQKESSCVVKNFAEVARQWSAVASVLAATKNQDSLDQFIKLDGLQFLNNWLQEALTCDDSTSDCSIEESIIALLGALDKLPVVQECSVSSIIMASVKDLFGHKSFRVQDKARALFDSWNRGRGTDIDNSNADKNCIPCDEDASASGNIVVQSGTLEQSLDETSLLRENGNGDVSTAACKTLIWADKDNEIQNSQESIFIGNESSKHSAKGTASTEILNVPVAKDADSDLSTLVSVKEPVVPDYDGADKSDSSQKRCSASDMDVVASKVEHETVDSNGPNYSENPVLHGATREGGDNCCNGLQDLDHDGSISGRIGDTCLVGNANGIIMKSLLTADVSDSMDDAKDISKINVSDSKVIYKSGKAQEVSEQVSNEGEQKGTTRLGSNDCLQDTSSSLATESAQVASNSGKGILDIDLNEEMYHEGMDCLNTPISSIAASGPPDGYKTISVEGSSYSSKKRQDLLEIDLNMTEGDIDDAADTVLTDQILASSCIISGESSIEVNSRRAGRHNLDLNSMGDNDDSPSSDGGRVEKSCHHYLHHAASSSSRQPLSTSIDLNENLCFVNDTNDHQTQLGNLSSHDMNSSGQLERDSGAICIMGRRVEIKGKDLAPSHALLPNGQSEISFMGSSLPNQLGFVGLQHAMASIPQLYGHTVLPLGPSASLSAMHEYGYVPYMVDGRGIPVAPEVIGSPIVFPHAYSPAPHPFLVSGNSTPILMNGVGSARASFDLNSSAMMVEGWTGELGGWTPGKNHLEESMGSTSQSLSSGSGMKRKEPDGGLDLYPYNYKQQQWWR